MRGYECIFYHKQGDKLIQYNNNACWAGLRVLNNQSIYIDFFRDKITEKYVDLLIGIINKITSCKIIKEVEVTYPVVENRTRYHQWQRDEQFTTEKREVIEFKCLGTYDRNLIVLNFIRYLWNKPEDFDTELFFASLEKSKHREPLRKLLYCNKVACSRVKYGGNHSNAYNKKVLKIKGVKQFNTEGFYNTREFLTRNRGEF